MPDLMLVMTTVATSEDAEHLARSMVSQCLAACVQVNVVDSVYRWQGAVQLEAEWCLSFKTTSNRYPALEQALRSEHPYEVAEIVAVPCARVSESYAHWVCQQVDANGQDTNA